MARILSFIGLTPYLQQHGINSDSFSPNLLSPSPTSAFTRTYFDNESKHTDVEKTPFSRRYAFCSFSTFYRVYQGFRLNLGNSSEIIICVTFNHLYGV